MIKKLYMKNSPEFYEEVLEKINKTENNKSDISITLNKDSLDEIKFRVTTKNKLYSSIIKALKNKFNKELNKSKNERNHEK